MNDRLRQVLLIYLRNEEQISWEHDSNSMIVKKSVYNECLRDIAAFIEQYVEGNVDQSFIDELDKRQRGE